MRIPVPALLILVLASLLLSINALRVPDLVGVDKSYMYSTKIFGEHLKYSLSLITPNYMRSVRMYYSIFDPLINAISYILVLWGLPRTIIYPFIFYLISMCSMYLFLRDFISSKYISILGAILYAINPVTPFYYPSISAPFAVALLPIVFKYFIRVVEGIISSELRVFYKNAILLALSLFACLSFHFQMLPVAVYILGLSGIMYLIFNMKMKNFKSIIIRISMLLVLVVVAMIPLLYSSLVSSSISSSIAYVKKISPESTLKDIRYTYATAGLPTFRLAGDQSTMSNKLGYDRMDNYINVAGYVYFYSFIFTVPVAFKISSRDKKLRVFILVLLLVYITSILTILFVRFSANTRYGETLAATVFFKSIRSPVKLRVYGYLAALSNTLILLDYLHCNLRRYRNYIIRGVAATLIVLTLFSMFIYSLPVAVNQLEGLPHLRPKENWVFLVSWINNETDPNDRGIILPYDHFAELYSPPWFRVAPLVSNVPYNEWLDKAYREEVLLSRILGLASIKYVILDTYWYYRGWGILLASPDINISRLEAILNSDSGLTRKCELGQFKVYENAFTLPLEYLTNNYILVNDDEGLLSTLKDLPLNNHYYVVMDLNTISRVKPISELKLDNVTLHITSGRPLRTINIAGKKYNATKIVHDDIVGYGSIFHLSNISISDIQLLSEKLLSEGELRVFKRTLIAEDQFVYLGSFSDFILKTDIFILRPGSKTWESAVIELASTTTNYTVYLIFHTNGWLELAENISGTYIPNVIVKHIGISNAKFSVSIHYENGKIQVFIQDRQLLKYNVKVSREYKVLVGAKKSRVQYNNLDITGYMVKPHFSAIIQGAPFYIYVYQYIYNPNYRIRGVSVLNAQPLMVNGFSNGWFIDQNIDDLNIDKIEVILPQDIVFRHILIIYSICITVLFFFPFISDRFLWKIFISIKLIFNKLMKRY